MAITSITTSALMLIVPWPLFIVGLFVGIGADRHVRLMRRLTGAAAWFALISALLAAVTYGLGATKTETYLAVKLPLGLGKLAESVYVNTLTVVMLLLVAFVGMIVSRYSTTYMDGDDHEGRFHRWLSLTLASFFTLIIAGNTWGFLISWVVTSLCLHKLLAFYNNRPGAVLAARKKYLFHRVADVSLLAAFVLINNTLHTTQFAAITPALAALHGSLPETLQIAAGLIVLSAILKSAQFPFHGWLIQVMEAPTPVSALLHAGIIYTGAFLILRTSPLMSRVGWAMDILVLVGLISIVTGSLMMITETNIKESLAYSTEAQMGFMLMECGLGLYSLAVLHIAAHSVYKAHAFLSSGSVVDNFRVPTLPSVPTGGIVWRGVLGFVVASLMTIGIGEGFGVVFRQQPALSALGIILVVAMTQLLLQAQNTRNIGTSGLLLRVVGLSLVVGTAYFGLHLLVTLLVGTSLPAAQLSTGILENSLTGLIVVVFLGLLLIQQMLPRNQKKPFWQAIYVHLYNGLYIDMFFTRMVNRLAPTGRAQQTKPQQSKPQQAKSQIVAQPRKVLK